jgi:RNA polymerase sigma factor (sigma-70 family)
MNTMPKAEPVDLPAPTAWDTDLVEVYRVGYGKLVRLAYLLTGHSAVAEEVVQDAFVATHRAGDQLRDPYPYVRRAVVNRCRSWGRRYTVERAHRPRPPDPAELAADEMWDALATLTDRQRTAIVLRFYEDMPDDRIAEILDCRQSTVRSAIHRGLQSLRRVIDL